jgi:predicted aspartyl protease
MTHGNNKSDLLIAMVKIIPMKYIIISLLSLSVQVHAQDISHYGKYLDCDIEYFTKDIDDSLYLALQDIVHGRYEIATEKLTHLLGSQADTIRSIAVQELINLYLTKKKYGKVNELIQLSKSEQKQGHKSPFYYFTRYPQTSFSLKDADSFKTEMYFDFYIKGIVNQRNSSEFIILDTGMPNTAVSQRFAKKHYLTVDTLQVTGVVSGFGLSTTVHSTLIDSIRMGQLTLYNVPAFVVENQLFEMIKSKGEMIFGLEFLMRFQKIEFDYQNKLFNAYKTIEKQDITPNFFIIENTPVTRFKIGKTNVIGLIDTGSPFTYLFKSDKWNPNNFNPSREEEKEWGDYKYTQKYYDFDVSSNLCWNGKTEFMIWENRNPPTKFHNQCIIGNSIWKNGKLSLDFLNNYACFNKE